MKQKIDDIELEELALEIIDMLGVALHFAGVKPENIQKAIDAYLEEIDTIDEDKPYGQKEMIEVIERLRTKKSFLFQ
ncbi:hypothetical protein BKH41_04985 [Helicobacter sp. 12S02232-10]|uniref:hypothetical protein n=1 Tax=Helicobacter sp. 12S02232-10 TaxID=1476197 RepID=UPI000BA75FBF|nr:hypothetical protein [Helicobacter sp. 12S02232-10]PAF48630.1 hypothetical protein BKH41_04985 [Helicobacter sp. 12S02232-10]